ncbi:MobF family relaxase [Massilia sp. CCM 8734]|uniref:MobF family relaxase n=1 Tax=Massilia sp. CCM 8734 TaxID=2609283 RepID=UPI0014242D22|nr:MobF family relaxase [Massilia sp. CCM 8734]NHZ99040.1 conjugative relaxase [Massilia sp. CCM 8734]
MLSMSNVSSVASAASYYAEDNYYSQDENKAMSEWAGKGAEALGLSGPIDPADFAKVLSGELGEEKLGKILGKDADGEFIREHRPGFDVTLSAPKSVSIVAEVGERADVREAHEAAVTKVLEYIEKNLVGARVTEAGETRFEKTGNVVAGRFAHTTSRDLDPQTHTHLVIANATMTESGHWRSISNELIYKNQKLLGNIYDSALAANLREKGYRLESTQDGRWEIAGITREQVEHFSQRSQAIAERLEKFGLTRETANAAQRENAALRTRDSKTTVDHGALREEWKERAQAIGVDFDKIEADRKAGLERPTDPATRDAKVEEAVSFAIAHLTERESVVDRGEVLSTALAHAVKESAWAGVTADQVSAALEDKLGKKVALAVGEDRITTTEALDREQAMLSMLESGRGAVKAVLSDSKMDAAIAAFEAHKSNGIGEPFKLTLGQEEAFRVALSSEDRYVGLQGYAGVGKTTMFELVRSAAEESGYTVRGMAMSAQAALTLQNETGIESVTNARFILDEGRRAVEVAKPEKIEVFGAIDMKGSEYRTWTVEVPRSMKAPDGAKEMWVMDEASLAGQREMTKIMEMAQNAGARLILVGDKLQLNAVEAGKPFEMLQRAGIHGAEMTEISRQKVEDLQLAVAAAVRRENGAALGHLEQRIVEIKDKGDLLARAAGDILNKHPNDRHDALLIVPLNDDRKAINNLVREGLQDRGEIAPDKIERNVLVPSHFTDAQTRSTAYYEPKMVVRFGRDYRSLDVERGEYATVKSVDRPGHVVTLETSDGRQVKWSPERHGKVEVYDQDVRNLAVGDELRFTRNNKEMGVNNGTLGKVVEISGDAIVLSTKTGQVTLKENVKSDAHFDYAYAMTVYGSQGRTTQDNNLLITSDSGKAMSERAFYVGITRPREDMTVYTDSKRTALKLIQEVQDKTSAVEELKTGDLVKGLPSDDETGKAAKGSSGGRSTGAEL